MILKIQRYKNRRQNKYEKNSIDFQCFVIILEKK
jgi:hypothetical protein